MPITVKFSKDFYDKLGHEIVDELVNWFNQVDATYHSDLRELNELNFDRFDAKVEQRFAESDAKMEKRFAESEARMERRFADVWARTERRFTQQDEKWEARWLDLNRDIEMARADTAKLRAEFLKWTLTFWAGHTLAVAALVIGVIKLT